MSEHVLCMVLYLIELGLDNQLQENKEDEVRSIDTHMYDMVKAVESIDNR